MADDLTPGEIRARKFVTTRRGYDRKEVGDFLDRVSRRMEELENELAAVGDRFHQLGITELPDLKEEIEDIGVEVQSILDAALAAAEGVRTRAGADAAARLGAADAAAGSLRQDAWETGTDLLNQAVSAADGIVAEAREDALFVRAEAERDAKRLVSEARRQADDMLRASREEGERIVVNAKAERDAILEDARTAAEKAQERARALEHRRTELLNELEEAESTIRDLEATRADRQEAADSGVRVVAPESTDRTHWPEDDGSVRILPPPVPEVTEPEPVDAEAMAAEVEQMRSAVTMPEPAEPSPEEAESLVAAAASAEDAVAPEIDAGEEPVLSAEVAGTGERKGGEDNGPAEVEPEDEGLPVTVTDKVTVVHDAPEIDALFALLRQEPEPAAGSAAISPATEPKDKAAMSSTAELAATTAEESAPEPEPEAMPRPPLHVVPDVAVTGEFDRRDRMLLPVENRGLRGLKRRIVELQNRVLEELRTSSGEWRLGRELVVELMGDELDAVLRDSYRAGHSAAAEAVGATEPQVTGGPRQGAAEDFTADLHRDVQAAMTRDSEGGARRLAADVGRVFRTWRTDEAERHVRQAARRAFNDGLLAGYQRLGAAAVEVVAPGRPCGVCSAGTGVSWDPAAQPPEGVVLPPAGPDCAAMIMVVGADGFVDDVDQ
jgi:DivIVA domain-containing protein